MTQSAPIRGLDERTTTPAVTKFVHVRAGTRRTLRGFVRSSAARDPLLRTVQYTLRLVLQYHLVGRPRKPSYAPHKLVTTLFALCSVLSALRRVLALEQVFHLVFRSPTRAEPPGPSSPSSRATFRDDLVAVSRRAFDLVAVVADSVYLGHRLGVVPASVVTPRAGRRVDRVSDVATLASVALGWYAVERQAERAARRHAATRTESTRLERDLDARRRSQGAHGSVKDLHEVEDETRLRERLEAERAEARAARDRVARFGWERWRLGAEGVFALYDVLDVQVAREVTKSLTGAAASFIE
ncbi:hypothetical protein JCM11491_000962 [Sporobolomyces phaffii]